MKIQINCPCGGKLVIITWFRVTFPWTQKVVDKFLKLHAGCVSIKVEKKNEAKIKGLITSTVVDDLGQNGPIKQGMKRGCSYE